MLSGDTAMNMVQPHSRDLVLFPTPDFSHHAHLRSFITGQSFHHCTEKTFIILNLEMHFLHLCATAVNDAEEIRVLVCTSDAEGAPNQKLWGSAFKRVPSGVSAARHNCSAFLQNSCNNVVRVGWNLSEGWVHHCVYKQDFGPLNLRGWSSGDGGTESQKQAMEHFWMCIQNGKVADKSLENRLFSFSFLLIPSSSFN